LSSHYIQLVIRYYLIPEESIRRWRLLTPLGKILVEFVDGHKTVYYDYNIRRMRFVNEESQRNKELYARSFGFNLRELLEEHCITAKEVAVRSGISERTISKIVQGKTIPTVYTAHQLARAIGCTTAELTDYQ